MHRRAHCSHLAPIARFALIVVLVCAGLPLAARNSLPARAASLVVTTTADSGPGSLRQTIADAASGDTITFDPATFPPTATTPAAITLASTLSVNDKGLTIQGPGQTALALDGNNMVRVLSVGTPATSLTLRDLTVRGGSTATAIGAGISNAGGKLILQRVSVTGNTGTGTAAGGIANSNGGTLGISFSTISGNTGAIGGGIGNVGGTVSLSTSTIATNTATTSGGGLATSGGGVTITNSTFTGNGASGNGTGGGAVYNANSTLSVANSTIAGNTSQTGGAGLLNAGGSTALTNDTIAANFAQGAAGIYIISGTVSAKNTLFTNNQASASGNCAGTLTADSIANLQYGDNGSCTVDNGAGGTTTVPGAASAPIADADPTTPQNHGGPTATLAIVTTTGANLPYGNGDLPTCNAAQVPNPANTGLLTGLDQRGAPHVANGVCSIGAYDPNLINSTVALTADRTMVAPGTTVTLTGTVTGVLGGGPSGKHLTINQDGALSADPLLTNGVATSGVSALSGAHGYTAVYSGGAAYAGGSSATLTITGTPIALTPTTLPRGTHGTAYSQTLAATGGAGGPYTYAITIGNLPMGLILGANDGTHNGQITGTPTQAGSSAFTVLVTDSAGATGQVVYVLTVATTLLSITRQGTDPTNDIQVSWQLTFADAITTVNPADFALVTGGNLTGARITAIAGGTPTVTFTATTGTGTGTLGFNYTGAGGTTMPPVANPPPVVGPLYHLRPTPTASDDHYGAPVNGVLTVPKALGLLSNDTSLVAGDTLTAAKASDPAHGSVTVRSDGGFTYTPAAGYTGTDSFTYTAKSGGGVVSAPATVRLIVAAPNAQPDRHTNGSAAPNTPMARPPDHANGSAVPGTPTPQPMRH